MNTCFQTHLIHTRLQPGDNAKVSQLLTVSTVYCDGKPLSRLRVSYARP